MVVQVLPMLKPLELPIWSFLSESDLNEDGESSSLIWLFDLELLAIFFLELLPILSVSSTSQSSSAPWVTSTVLARLEIFMVLPEQQPILSLELLSPWNLKLSSQRVACVVKWCWLIMYWDCLISQLLKGLAQNLFSWISHFISSINFFWTLYSRWSSRTCNSHFLKIIFHYQFTMS